MRRPSLIRPADSGRLGEIAGGPRAGTDDGSSQSQPSPEPGLRLRPHPNGAREAWHGQSGSARLALAVTGGPVQTVLRPRNSKHRRCAIAFSKWRCSARPQCSRHTKGPSRASSRTRWYSSSGTGRFVFPKPARSRWFPRSGRQRGLPVIIEQVVAAAHRPIPDLRQCSARPDRPGEPSFACSAGRHNSRCRSHGLAHPCRARGQPHQHDSNHFWRRPRNLSTFRRRTGPDPPCG